MNETLFWHYLSPVTGLWHVRILGTPGDPPCNFGFSTREMAKLNLKAKAQKKYTMAEINKMAGRKPK